MRSPCPGMDPCLEGQEWEDFHSSFNVLMRDTLSSKLEPKYFARVERRVYLERDVEDQPDQPQWRRSDLAIVTADPWWSRPDGGSDSAVATLDAPVECLVPMAEERRETYLVIRERTTFEVVTVLETLSPANKQTTADGHREYLKKREELLESKSHFIELDLLRGGQRMPLCEPRPRGDFFAMVSRVEKRPRVDVFAWTLRQRMPEISIPLAKGDPDVKLDLQAVFDTVYASAHYELSLNYQTELRPALNTDDAAWLHERIAQSTTAPENS